MSEPVRDFVGYGPTPPDPRWPRGARVALNIVLNFEEGSERSIADGDGLSEASPGQPSPVARGERDLATESMFEYGSRVGIWRLLKLLRERDLPFTMNACAQALERNPAVAVYMREANADICCHGWRWAQHFTMSETEERSQIARAVASLEATTGRRPDGWYCRFGPSVNTRTLLVEHGGFLYDSDAYNDELPYWTEVKGAAHLVVPYSLVHNDGLLGRGALGTGDDFFAFLRDSIETLRDEGGRMMSVGLHMRIAGHPGWARGLARFLDHIAAMPDVWVCTRGAIARHWHAHHVPEQRI